MKPHDSTVTSLIDRSPINNVPKNWPSGVLKPRPGPANDQLQNRDIGTNHTFACHNKPRSKPETLPVSTVQLLIQRLIWKRRMQKEKEHTTRSSRCLHWVEIHASPWRVASDSIWLKSLLFGSTASNLDTSSPYLQQWNFPLTARATGKSQPPRYNSRKTKRRTVQGPQQSQLAAQTMKYISIQ